MNCATELSNRQTGGILFSTLQKFGRTKAERDAGRPHPLLSEPAQHHRDRRRGAPQPLRQTWTGMRGICAMPCRTPR